MDPDTDRQAVPTAPAPLDYAGPPESSRRNALPAGAWVAVVILLLVVAVPAVLTFVPSLTRSRQFSSRAKCANNLRQIGTACLLYAHGNGGRFPDTLDQVLVAESVDPSTFVCPSSSDTPARGASVQAQAANLTTGGHLSYVYLGKGLTTQSITPETVLLHELPSNHQDQSINVVYGDGHVECETGQRATKLLQELGTGHNPPRPEQFR